jgi:Ca2+:H+ antiporter
MFLCYTCCIIFQLNSHGYLFDAEAAKRNEANVYGDQKPPKRDFVFILNPKDRAKAAAHADESSDPLVRTEEEVEEPQMIWPIALFLLTVATAFSAFTAEIVVDSIDGMAEHLSKEFVALILLPIAVSILSFSIKA